MLNKFAEELKAARESSGLTLQQIASKTRIDLKFLENLEKGNFAFLPDLYIKAFIKEYSRMVGLDEAVTMKKFEAARAGKQYDEKGDTEEELKKVKEEPKAKPGPAAPAPTYEPEYSPSSNSENRPAKTDKQKMMIGAIAGGIVIVFLIIYFAFLRGSSEIIVTEKPYDQVRKENKQRYIEETPKSEPADTAITVSSDSLSLMVEANDTSWIKILLDGSTPEEFTLFPDSRKNIKAKSSYQMIIGNAAAMRFKLNNKPLSFSGKKNEVKYISIDSTGLKYLTTPPNFPQ